MSPNAPLNLMAANLDLKDVLDLLKKDIFLSLNCHALGLVQSYNNSTKTIKATIAYGKTYYNQAPDGQYLPVIVNYPILVDVPILFLGGGQAGLTFPIAQNDECLILFNDRDIDNWFAGATSGAVNSNRLHSFSDGLALVFRFHNLSTVDSVRALISNGTVSVGINPQSNKATITNGTSLGTILGNILTQLENLANTVAVSGNPLSPSIATQLGMLKTQLAGLLE